MSARALRNGGVAFLARARNGISSGFMYRPPWFDAAVQFQPMEPLKNQGGATPQIVYPEDMLLRRARKRHPELWTVCKMPRCTVAPLRTADARAHTQRTIVQAVPDEQGKVLYQHPANQFIARQKYWIGRGHSVDEAFDLTTADLRRQKRFERVELQTAMLQAEQMRGVEEVGVDENFEQRLADKWAQALKTRLRRDAQIRREKLELLMESRDAEGETDNVDLTRLDEDVLQDDLYQVVANDVRAQEHFGTDGTDVHVEVERLLPDRNDPLFEEFRTYLDAEMPSEMRAILLAADPATLPSPRHARFFKLLDGNKDVYGAMEERQRQRETLAEERLATAAAAAAEAEEAAAAEMGAIKPKGPRVKKPAGKRVKGGKKK